MKVALNEVKSFNERYQTTGDIAPEGVEKLVEKIGAQLGAVEEVIDVGKKYENIAIVKVVSCKKHPDADKLNLCLISDDSFFEGVERNEQHLIQVVCGAPNVREGMLAVWIPPGATVPSTLNKDPFVVEVREIRTQKSNGMLASLKELGIGDNHEGILEVDKDVRPGVPFSEAYDMDDYVIDIENKMFTHRPDLFGMMGIARELAGIQSMQFKSPDWYTPNPEIPGIETEELSLEVRNEVPELVPRFMAITMSDVKVEPSPLWLQLLLNTIGMKPINNIVDYTNYYMYLTAQPLHAYDYDKVKGKSQDRATIVVRHPKERERVKLLNGKEVESRNDAIMIATDKELIGLGGVMGGRETEVDEKTKNIILECANFDMYSIRRTSMQHGLFTDAVTRFTKGQSPLQNTAVLGKIVDEIRRFAGGKVASEAIDIKNEERMVENKTIEIEVNFINSRLGAQISSQEIANLLQNVEFEVTQQQGASETLGVKAPFWRTDIEIPEDIVEEVGRLRGYDSVPLVLPKRSTFPVGPDLLLGFKHRLRTILAKLGANEILSYSFTHASLLEKVGQNKNSAFKIANALSPELQYYRLSLTPSLLEKVHTNIKAGYDQFALFEIGKSHAKEFKTDDLPHEFERVALVCASQKEPSAHSPTYFEAKHYLTHLLETLGIDGAAATFEPLSSQETDQATTYYQPGRAATVKIGGTIIGWVGEYKSSVVAALKLPAQSAGFELDVLSLLKYADSKTTYRPLSKYPSLSQDICLEVAGDLPYGELAGALDGALKENLTGNETFTLTPLDIYSAQKLKGRKRVTFRIVVTSYERTLTESDVSTLLEKTATKLANLLGAVRI